MLLESFSNQERRGRWKPLAQILILITYEAVVLILLMSHLAAYPPLFKPLSFAETLLFVLLLFLPVMLPELARLSRVKIPLVGGGSIEVELQEIHRRIEREQRRLDHISNNTDNVVGSLASLLIAPPPCNSVYRRYVDDRVTSRKTLLVGCDEFTEQRLLCAIVTMTLRKYAHFQEVIPRYNFGGLARNFIALARGGIDVLPAYTWSGFEIAFASALPQVTPALRSLPQDKTLEQLNQIFSSAPSRAYSAEGRTPSHRSREAQRAACRSAVGRRSRPPLEAASAESEGPKLPIIRRERAAGFGEEGV